MLSIPPNTSVASFTLSVTWRGLFLSIPCFSKLRALANLSIFSVCSFRSCRTFFHPSALEKAISSLFPKTSFFVSIDNFTSASCVEERVGIFGNGFTLRPKSYPSSLRPNVYLAGPGIQGQTGLIRSNTGSDNTHYLIKVPKWLAPDPAWHTTSAELGSHQPLLLVGRGRRLSATYHSQLDATREQLFGLFLVTDCGGFAVSPRRFHTPIRSLPHSRESPSIEASLTFEGHISQSCGTDIRAVHSFLAGTRRLILSAAAWGIHPSLWIGIDAFIASPAFNLG